jgi:Ca2+-binding RTX toxin-like protein
MANGSPGNDYLSNIDPQNYGFDGNDTINGNIVSGTAYADGGKGNDLIAFSQIDTVTALGKAYGGEGNDRLMGTWRDDYLDGGDGSDFIQANTTLRSGGTDTLVGGGGADGLYGHYGNDIIHGGDGDDQAVWIDQGPLGFDNKSSGFQGGLYGDYGDDQLFGDGGNDDLYGGFGRDMLDGGTGSDRLHGGLGDDAYYVTSTDSVFENAGEGLDVVYALETFVLGAGQEVELLTAKADADIDLTGNEFDQTFYGTDGDNSIFGLGGDDDIYGGYGADDLHGGDGNDMLFSTDESDELYGDGGDDLFIVASNEKVFESAGQGKDKVAVMDSYVLGKGQEIEQLYAFSGYSVFQLTGNELSQEIVGNAAANILHDGGAGSADTLRGLGGDDVYLIYNSDDVIVEVAGEGSFDRAGSAVDFALGAGVYVEKLTTTTQTGTAAIDLKGNALQQEIVGNAGSNVLHDGGVGAADTLRGLGGNDTYRIFNAGDKIVERGSEGAYDVVMAAVDYVLTQGAYIERLATNGTAGTSGIDLTGNELVQEVVGNSGANRLDGKGGDDIVKGLGGNDTLAGGTGTDVFVFNSALSDSTNVDIISDFSVAADTIHLDNAFFTALTTTGALTASTFKDIADGPKDASDRIIYNSDTGNLYYDADGSGGLYGNVKFAVIATLAQLTAAAFEVI